MPGQERGNDHAMRGRREGRHGRPGEARRRRFAMLIALILLAMIAGLAAGLAASLAHLNHGPPGRRARAHARQPWPVLETGTTGERPKPSVGRDRPCQTPQVCPPPRDRPGQNGHGRLKPAGICEAGSGDPFHAKPRT
jgi:hypothetical protein